MKIYEFKYKAKNQFSQIQKGILLAKNMQEVENILLAKGYKNIKINRNFKFSVEPNSQEFNQFITQLALLFNAKITLKQALNISLKSCLNIRLYQWIKKLINLLEGGYSLSDALVKLNKYIKPQEIQLIKMAEQSGQLSTIFYNMSKSREKTEKLTKKVKKILFYPVIVLVISIVLSLLLLIFIVPQFAQLYQSKERALPLITDILFSLSHFLQEYSMYLITFTLFIFSIIFILNKKTMVISKLVFKILSNLPIFKDILKNYRLIFFCQNTALMLQSGIPLNRVLSSFISEQDPDVLFQREIIKVQMMISKGFSFSSSLNPMIFNEQSISMMTIGEQGGQLINMLNHIAENTQQQLDYKVDLLSQMLEPVLMLVIGTIVGTIIIGLYLPIFDIGSLM